MNQLFRPEAEEHIARRLEGSVVLSTPISSQLFTIIAALFMVTAAVFSCTASFSRKETVSGWIVPKGGLIRVLARNSGIIENITVKEGQYVDSQSQLATLKVSNEVASGDSGAELERDLRLEEKANTAQSIALVAKLKAQFLELKDRKQVLISELQESERRANFSAERLALATADIDRNKALFDKGIISKSALDNILSNRLGYELDSSTARATLLEIRRQISDLDHEISQIPLDIEQQEAQQSASSASLDQRHTAAKAQHMMVITAPIGGHIVTIPVEQGSTVSADTAIAILTPNNSLLTAQLYVPSKASGFIRIGQHVRVMYQAFSYQIFGAVVGTVSSISRSALAPSDVPIPGEKFTEPVFRVSVDLPKQYIKAYNQNIPLQPGMLLNADIILDHRNLFQWLIDPLYAASRR